MTCTEIRSGEGANFNERNPASDTFFDTTVEIALIEESRVIIWC